jgi:D-alanyl-D-alanine carboxypeptidase (penicillin-binding protein 5/6)
MNAETGAVLYEKHAHVPVHPASTTKVATALYVLDEKGDLSQPITVSSNALKMKGPKQVLEAAPYWLTSDGTMMGLAKGETLSLEVLLHGMLMVSGNDAANVIAEGVSGSIHQFMQELNQYLQRIGCKNTLFLNPHGLHHPEHVTTAYDLALMMQKAVPIPSFRQIISKRTYRKPKTNKQPEGLIKAFNPMIQPGKYFYSKIVGGKTGFHSAAQNSYVVAAEQDGRTLIAVLLGCTKREERYEDARNLFEAAFGEKKMERVLVRSDELFTKSYAGAKTALAATLASNLEISFYPAEEPEVKAYVHWDSVSLPIRKGQRVGEIRALDSAGRILASSELFARTEVKGTFFFVLKEQFNHIFR